ncbi:uncharacterized protein LOC131255770 [Magnolia sinica]|uniref:uncharacterized protein LOC131255770 n=1 Tax=Magnolia sinica TaxID=86752 RepID=UPI00265A7262|nr:uncharacterized protein LOC131255770 [Magnolia sinica]XP_058112573.1 uncharacterized protein LOC131255770 [Magnolia sinica]
MFAYPEIVISFPLLAADFILAHRMSKYACGFLFSITGSHPLKFKEMILLRNKHLLRKPQRRNWRPQNTQKNQTKEKMDCSDRGAARESDDEPLSMWKLRANIT